MVLEIHVVPGHVYAGKSDDHWSTWADVLLPTCKAEGYTYGLEEAQPVFTELSTGEKITQGHAKLPWMKSAFRVLRVEMYPRFDPLWNYVRSIPAEEIRKESAA